MGKRDRLRRAAFFAEHPWCCFCGGDAPASEEDHIPGRHLFKGRQWPEGYVFPACSACNDASSLDELVLGWLVRIRLDDYDEVGRREAQAAFDKLRRRRPEWVQQSTALPRIDVRRLLRERNLTASDFPNGEVYAMTVPEEYGAAMSRYAEKLARALYYRHTKRVLPRSGVVRSRAVTNVEFTAPDFNLSNFEPLKLKPVLSRAGQSLEDQFSYRYAVHPEGRAAGFLVQFAHSIAMAMLVVEDCDAYAAEQAAWDASGAASEEA